MDPPMKRVDRAALKRAIIEARKQDPARRRQVDSMLSKRDWFEVARFCACCCQTAALQLKPWQPPPVWVGDEKPIDDFPSAGRVRAWELRRQLLAAGLSMYEPDPLAALREREQAAENPPERGGKSAVTTTA
jgi:hypothetical protein